MMNLTFQVNSVDQALALMTFYQTIKRAGDALYPESDEKSDAEKRLRSITLTDMIKNYGLTVRSASILAAEELVDAYSIGKMFAKDSGRSMLKIPNLGKKVLQDIEMSLHHCGFFEFAKHEEKS